jgi:hypothetical protein
MDINKIRYVAVDCVHPVYERAQRPALMNTVIDHVQVHTYIYIHIHTYIETYIRTVGRDSAISIAVRYGIVDRVF